MGIGSRVAYNDVKLEPTMVLSNEPGYYQDGEFGIRIESLVVVKNQQTPHEFGGVKYFGMEHLTMVRFPWLLPMFQCHLGPADGFAAAVVTRDKLALT